MAKRKVTRITHTHEVDGYQHAAEPDCRCAPVSSQEGNTLIYLHRTMNPNTGRAVEDES